MTQMPDLLVVSGPAGAGKSTVASLVSARLPRSAVVRGDDFFSFLDKGAVVPWLPEAVAQNEIVTRAAAAAAGALTEGFAVVYDGLVAPGFINSFLDATGLDGLSYALLLPPVDVCLARVVPGRGTASPMRTSSAVSTRPSPPLTWGPATA